MWSGRDLDLDLLTQFYPKFAEIPTNNSSQINSNYHHLMFYVDKMAPKSGLLTTFG